MRKPRLYNVFRLVVNSKWNKLSLSQLSTNWGKPAITIIILAFFVFIPPLHTAIKKTSVLASTRKQEKTFFITAIRWEPEKHKQKRPEHAIWQPPLGLPRQRKSELAVRLLQLEVLQIDFFGSSFLRWIRIFFPDPRSHKKKRTQNCSNREHRQKLALFSLQKVSRKSTEVSPTRCWASGGHGHVLCCWLPVMASSAKPSVQQSRKA